MSQWLVTFNVGATGFIKVEAETEDEAREIAENTFVADDENTEIGDADEIVDVQRMTE